jgi:hypothetical protein
MSVMRFRAGIAVTTAVFLVMLLGPAGAQAHHGFSVSTPQAAPGDQIEFSISDTQPGESYVVTVENEEVSSGVADAGSVTDRFNMPDLGNSSRSVAIEVQITPVGGDVPHSGYKTIKYSPAFTGPTEGSTVTAPAPVTTVPVVPASPGSIRTPRQRAKPPVAKKRTPTHGQSEPRAKHPSVTTPTGGQTPASTFTPAATTPSSSTPGSSGRKIKPFTGSGRSKTVSPGAAGPNVPPLAPEGAPASAPAPTPLSGLANVGKTGFPVLVVVVALLLLAAALTAAGPRLWQRWQPALFGPPTDDDMRLVALKRASASGAELQKTIAARRATRRTN